MKHIKAALTGHFAAAEQAHTTLTFHRLIKLLWWAKSRVLTHLADMEQQYHLVISKQSIIKTEVSYRHQCLKWHKTSTAHLYVCVFPVRTVTEQLSAFTSLTKVSSPAGNCCPAREAERNCVVVRGRQRERDWSANMHIGTSCFLVFVQNAEPGATCPAGTLILYLITHVRHRADTPTHKKIIEHCLRWQQIMKKILFWGGSAKCFFSEWLLKSPSVVLCVMQYRISIRD